MPETGYARRGSAEYLVVIPGGRRDLPRYRMTTRDLAIDACIKLLSDARVGRLRRSHDTVMKRAQALWNESLTLARCSQAWRAR